LAESSLAARNRREEFDDVIIVNHVIIVHKHVGDASANTSVLERFARALMFGHQLPAQLSYGGFPGRIDVSFTPNHVRKTTVEKQFQ
jgi:hypothetical protein